MQKIDGFLNRDSFPEHDPKFWRELAIFSDALEESLLIKKLQYENKADEMEGKDIGMSKEEMAVIDKLIFWRLCSSIKNRYAVIEILLNKGLQNPSRLLKENIHMLEELYCGRLFPEEQMKGSKEFEYTYSKMLQGERKFTDKLNNEQKEEFYKIIHERVMVASQQDKECFIYGFQYASLMFLSVYMEYNKDN